MPRQPAPWGAHELADYATHDIRALGMIASRAPTTYHADLVHIAETLRRLAVIVDALADEPTECTMRVAARAQAYEQTLKRETDGLAGIDSADTMQRLFARHRALRSSGDARARGVGFERGGEVYGGG